MTILSTTPRAAKRAASRAGRATAWISCVAVGLLVTWSAPASAEPEQALAAEGFEEPRADASASSWSFEIIPYLWVPTVQASASVGPQRRSIDVGIGEAFDLAGSADLGGAMARFEARRQDLGLFVDGEVLGVDANVDTSRADLGARLKVLAWLVEWGASYRVLEYADPGSGRAPVTLDLLAGARWNRISLELGNSIADEDQKSKLEFVDPIVGGKFAVPVWGSGGSGDVSIIFRGDIGGFGAGSELAWNVLSGLRWDMPWTLFSADLAAILGYRAYYVRATDTSGGQTSELALQTGGPALGLALGF